jgi:hypothetical protein|tara:strand:+ start:2406 stop:3272 length:867 start_codon:yes stop_codon:yes gene_type:complete
MPDLKYIFNNDYSRLNSVNALYNITSRLTNVPVFPTLSGSEGLSARIPGRGALNANGKFIYSDFDTFTGPLGELNFQPNFENTDSSISDSNYFFDFGDGTTGSGLSTFHIYESPGLYNVTFVVTDSAGNFFKGVQEKKLKVIDPLQDSLYLTLDGLSTQKSSIPERIITVTRFNSLNSSRVLSANDYSINLSVSGQANIFYTNNDYYNDNNFQYKKGSYLIKDVGNNFEVIDSIKTSSDNIFANYTVPTIVSTISALSVLNLNFSPKQLDNSIFIGTSGRATFRYFED